MLNKTLESIDYLETNRRVYDLLTPRGEELMQICKEHLKGVKASLTPIRLASMPNLNDTTLAGDLVY